MGKLAQRLAYDKPKKKKQKLSSHGYPTSKYPMEDMSGMSDAQLKSETNKLLKKTKDAKTRANIKSQHKIRMVKRAEYRKGKEGKRAKMSKKHQKKYKKDK